MLFVIGNFDKNNISNNELGVYGNNCTCFI